MERAESLSHPKCSLALEGRNSPADEAVVVEARDLSKTYILGRVRVPALRRLVS